MLFTPKLALVGLFLATDNAASTAGPIVDLGYAKYQGVSNTTTGLTTFFGIRYAAAPTGEAIFARPNLNVR